MKLVVDGPENAPLLVFVHGWPDNPDLWRKQIAFFQDKYRCVRVTLPHADGELVSRAGFSFDEVRDQIIQAIEGELAKSPSQSQVTLIGHDWGAFLSYRIEEHRPDLIARLITLDVGARLRPRGFKQIAAVLTYQWWLVGAFYIGRVFPPAGDVLTKIMAKALRAPYADRVRWFMNYFYARYWGQMLRHGAKWAQTKGLPSAPFLYIYGEKKPIMFHTERWLAEVKADPRNQVLALPKSGHWMMLSHADEVNAAIADSLSK